MFSLELSNDQAVLLKNYLQRTLSELSQEIAATDALAYRERLKAERRLLQEVSAQLEGVQPES